MSLPYKRNTILDGSEIAKNVFYNSKFMIS